MKYLLDTHAVVWLLTGDKRFGERAAEALVDLSRQDVFVADICLLEIALIQRLGRIQVDQGLESLLNTVAKLYTVLPITGEIAAQAVALPLPQGDPFDRVIAATAVVHGLTLVTKDRQLTASGAVDVLW